MTVARPRQFSLDLASAPVFTRAAFVTSAANAAAVAQVNGWRAWPGGVLALVGPEGSGKTHLGRVWAEEAGATVLATGDDAPDAGPLLLEDADAAPDEQLFHLINRGGGLLLTSRKRPAAWACALPDLRSRLNALTVAELGEPDDALLIAVMEALFREKHIRAAPDLYEYLLRRMDRSVAAARALVARLDQAAGEQGRPVNRLLAREVLEETADLFED